MVLRSKIINFAEFLKKRSKNGDVVGILGDAKTETFFRKIAPITNLAGFHVLKEVGFAGGEVENPGVGRVEVVGFLKFEFGGVGGMTKFGGGERQSRFNTKKKSIFLLGEAAKSGKSGF